MLHNTNEERSVIIHFPYRVGYLLGFRRRDVEKKNTIRIFLEKNAKVISDTKFDANIFLPSLMMVYCAEISPSYIGNVQAPILKTLPIIRANNDTKYRTMEIKHLEFHELTSTQLTTLSFKLRDETGDPIIFDNPFNLENVCINLMFREK